MKLPLSPCEPLNSRDPCSRREAATSKRVRPWARGEGCASQLCSRSSELCCEPSGVPWKPLLSEAEAEAEAPLWAPGQGWEGRQAQP